MSEKLNFRVMRQGYDRFEVDKTIAKFHEDKENLEQKLNLCQNRIKALESSRDGIDDQYRKLVREISIREKAAEEMARLALREANTIIETAYGNADLIVREAMSTARQLLVEISRITNESQELREELSTKVVSLHSILQELEFPEIPKSSLINKDQDKKRQ